MKLAFDVNVHFARFFSDPIQFRRLQAATHCVVSGSTALQFFNREVYPDSDLDLYVDFRNALDVCQFILDDVARAYTFLPCGEQDRDFTAVLEDFVARGTQHFSENQNINEGATGGYGLEQVLEVFSFVSRDEENRVLNKVQVVVTDLNPFVSMLTFHSSKSFSRFKIKLLTSPSSIVFTAVVMNAITFKAAYSLYPKGTLEDKKMLLTGSPRKFNHKQALEKYVRRGWHAVRSISPDEQADSSAAFRFGKRWVTDSNSWILPLDTGDLEVSKHTADPFASQSFNLVCNAENLLPEIRFTIIRHDRISELLVSNVEFGEKVLCLLQLFKEGNVQTSPHAYVFSVPFSLCY